MVPSKLDQAIIGVVSKDLPLVNQPFKMLAGRLGIGEDALLGRLREYKKSGLMRKFCASLNHKSIGFKHNAMVVWNIPDKSINSAGDLMASFTQVSHCYQRQSMPGWNYNLYSMIHGRTKQECIRVIRAISRKVSCRDYRVLFSRKEYKKTPGIYPLTKATAFSRGPLLRTLPHGRKRKVPRALPVGLHYEKIN